MSKFFMVLGALVIAWLVWEGGSGSSDQPEKPKYLTPQEVETKRIDEEWERLQKDPAALEARKQEIIREAAADKAKKDQEYAACRNDVQCWAEKYFAQASVACREPVEHLAKYDFEWSDGWIDPKFSHYRWQSQKRAIVTYIGDKLKLQNGFGAKQVHTYYCDFDTNNGKVLNVYAKPGRI